MKDFNFDFDFDFEKMHFFFLKEFIILDFVNFPQENTPRVNSDQQGILIFKYSVYSL